MRIDRRELIEFDDYVAPDGRVYKFDTGAMRFLVSFTGLGMPPVEYISQRGPFQHGETLVDYRLRPRTIQFVHSRRADSRQGYWDARADILNLLRPNRQLAGQFQPGTLRKILPDGSVRCIDVLIEQGPVFAPRTRDQWSEWNILETLRFIAYDPTFYDPEPQVAAWLLTTLDNLVFGCTPNAAGLGCAPWTDSCAEFPIVFGGGVISDTLVVTYPGTWPTFPTIVITGPLNAPAVRNVTTGEKIELEYNIPAGDTVTITLAYGFKTVIDNHGTNLIGTVSTDSDLATFHIAPEPEAPSGANELNVVGASGTPATSVRIEWLVRYIGI